MPAKKRRKRRKRSVPILTSTSFIRKSYYEHDNRKLQNNYAAVAKKFRPLITNETKSNIVSKKYKNALRKSSSQNTSSEVVVKNALSIDGAHSASLLTLPLLLQFLNETYFNAFAHFGVQEQQEISHITQRVRETHQIAAAQQEKNAKLREAFNISDGFVDGSSFGCYNSTTKNDITKNMALQKELDEQIGALKSAAPTFEVDKSSRATTSRSDKEYDNKSEKKKKKKRQRSRSSSPEYKSSKRKKSKKQKKERLVH